MLQDVGSGLPASAVEHNRIMKACQVTWGGCSLRPGHALSVLEQLLSTSYERTNSLPCTDVGFKIARDLPNSSHPMVSLVLYGSRVWSGIGSKIFFTLWCISKVHLRW